MTQIAEQMGVSRKTIKRMLCVNPEYICVDGTQTRKTHRQLDPYREQIQELIERGFQTSQILRRLQEQYPDIHFKRTTVSDFCVKLRTELYTYTQLATKSPPASRDNSILAAYMDKIKLMLNDEKQITVIYAAIKADGFPGSYSLLQQYCHTVKPKASRIAKRTRKIKRRDLATLIWSGKTGLSEEDLSNIESRYPVLMDIKRVILDFREAYSKKDNDAVMRWCGNYAQCPYPAIRSFINGINADADAFYNSIKYEYSNGVLEGTVNKLKAVKRSMFGRASYALLRAKLLLAQKD